MPNEFSGFKVDLFQFLADLENNNDRDWFAEHRERYERDVREPAHAFIRSMAPDLKKLSPRIVASDRKVGGSLMRVHRDLRFAPDQAPYKTNVGIQFRHTAGKDVHAPGLYVHIALDSCFLGAGLWRPEREALAGIRKAIAERPEAWRRLWRGKAMAGWQLGGDTLKRGPRGFDPEHPLIEELKRKDFIAIFDLKHDRVLSPRFRQFVLDRFRQTRPLMRFLSRSIGLDF